MRWFDKGKTDEESAMVVHSDRFEDAFVENMVKEIDPCGFNIPKALRKLLGQGGRKARASFYFAYVPSLGLTLISFIVPVLFGIEIPAIGVFFTGAATILTLLFGLGVASVAGNERQEVRRWKRAAAKGRAALMELIAEHYGKKHKHCHDMLLGDDSRLKKRQTELAEEIAKGTRMLERYKARLQESPENAPTNQKRIDVLIRYLGRLDQAHQVVAGFERKASEFLGVYGARIDRLKQRKSDYEDDLQVETFCGRVDELCAETYGDLQAIAAELVGGGEEMQALLAGLDKQLFLAESVRAGSDNEIEMLAEVYVDAERKQEAEHQETVSDIEQIASGASRLIAQAEEELS